MIQLDDARDDEVSAGTMPNTVAGIEREGARFSRYYATTPACCPSRTSLLTGRYTHNHRVLTNALEGGGYRAFKSHPAFESNLAVWLQRANYRTAHIGKFLNWYGQGDGLDVPPGWDTWATTIAENEPDPYYSYQLNVNGSVKGGFQRSSGCGAEDITRGCAYLTDQITARALAVIQKTDDPRPFYLQLDYTAPHADLVPPEGPEPPARHSQRFRNFQIRRGPSFNERDLSDKPSFVRRLPAINRQRLGRLTKRERNRLRSLRGVDDGVGQLLDALTESGLSERTWIFFVSDNGYLLGEHRIEASKFVPYEPATQVPLLIRGPEVEPGISSSEVVGNIDIAPTILQIAGAAQGRLDGRSLLPFLADPSRRTRRPLLLEAFNPADVSAARDAQLPATEAKTGPLSYRGIIAGRYKLIRYLDYQTELYDLARDPEEIHSLDNSAAHNGVRRYLRRALTARENCAGLPCSRPLRTAPPRPAQAR